MDGDIWFIFEWWGTLFLVGAAAFPLARFLFKGWFDEGYLFAKAVGMAVVTWIVYVLATTKFLPFTKSTIIIALAALFLGGLFLGVGGKGQKRARRLGIASFLLRITSQGLLFFVEELFFFGALLFWSWIKAHEPSIHGLEKFMDFGFTKSILNSAYFPPSDMWYAGFPINYYYFGHLVMATLTKLSELDLVYTFNLMLATIFAFTMTMSFSIGKQLTKKIRGGILTAFLVTLAGNMQTLYAFTKGYTGDSVKPFWELFWPITDFLQKFPEGLNRYWYANATRFIPFTIHEFPSYSFVVSDVHGHVLSLPFVLLAIGLLVQIFTKTEKESRGDWGRYMFYGFLVGVLLMTNALDGPIYLGLFLVLFILYKKKDWKKIVFPIGIVLVTAAVSSIPFLSHFQSFVHGLAINCPPAFLANAKIGPFLFEGVEKCQHSPIWMMLLLWGFFIYCGIWLLGRFRVKPGMTERLLVIFFLFSLVLIIFPEFFYFKDIYPMHFRSNTMFKLGYQAFIMFSIVSAYTIVKLIKNKLFFILLVPQLFLVSIYPIFSVRSYFGELKDYKGLDGAAWIKQQYPDDWKAIEWLNTKPDRFTIVEADGDSYTDYNRISAFTGDSTIVGWAVHEWLWRGGYDAVSPRRDDVRIIYESQNVDQTRAILQKYHVRYVIIGTLERQKFKNLYEIKFTKLGESVFRSGETVVYRAH